MKSKHLSVLAFLFFQILLFSESFEFSFDTFNLSQEDRKDIIKMEKTFCGNNPGAPNLPVKVVYFIVPFGKDVKKISCSSEQFILEGEYDISPVVSEYPTSEIIYPTEKNTVIYSKNQFYPVEKYRKIGVQRKNGVDVLIIQLFPFQYNPVTRKLIHHKKMGLNVEFAQNSYREEEQIQKLLNYEKLSEIFSSNRSKNKFMNQDALSSYQGKSRYWKNSRTSLVSSDDPYDYIIITNQILENEWSELVTQKESYGLNVNIYTTEDIYANYTGSDNPEKIRNFIIDAYDTWSGTANPLQWILLGGDSNIVTARSVRCHGYWSSSWHYYSMYTDNYYAGLDGDWNNDADSYFGEGDNDQVPDDFPETWILGTSGEEADWFFEVNIGRAILEDASEIDNWLNKTISYEDLSCSENYLKTLTLVGQYLGYTAYGGTAMDEIAMFLPEFNHNRLYQMNGTYSKANVVDAINNGTHIISHLGHANYLRVFDIYDGDVDTLLTNTDYCFVYTQGCHTGRYYGLECIAESFLKREHGTFAYIGNTHYGFYSSYKDQGASQLFEREFFDAIRNEGITNLGNANYDSKEDLAGIIGPTGARRWVGMDLTLFGDPHLSLHLDVGDVSAEQTTGNEITISYEENPGPGADNYENYNIYERDEPDSTIGIISCSVNGNNVVLYLEDDLKEGIPYNVEISNVSQITNPTIRPIDVLSNIIELSIITPTIWPAEDGPYYIYEDLIVKGSNLTIEAGTEIKMYQGKEVVVYDNGWLKANGTEDEKVVFTSYDDSDRASNGDWLDIFFYRDADHDNCEIDHCLIEYATTGIWLDSTSTATIKNTSIIYTKESGIYSYCANPTIENVIVAFASGSDNNHGFYFENSEPQINNIVSYENDYYGIYAADSSNVVLNNSIIYGNIAGSILNDSSSVLITYSDLEGGFFGAGNIDEDPLFADPSNNDFFLQSDSPCIDTGDPDSPRDQDGTRADMGAIYYPHLFDFTADKMFGYDSLEVTFTDLTEREITNWSWDFDNDGVYDSFEESPTFSYTQPGVYSVKMKIEKTAWSDTLTKTNFIVIQQSQLDPPENLTITIDSNDVFLEWSAIDTTRFDNSRNELFYLIYYSDNLYDSFDFLGYTIGETTSFTHQDIIPSNDCMFYQIIGYAGTLERMYEFIERNKIGKLEKLELFQKD